MVTDTLAVLAAELGAPNPVITARVLSTSDPNARGRLGATIASSKVAKDGRRMVAQAVEIWNEADADQRKLLRGVSPPVFAVHVAQVQLLEELIARQAAQLNTDKGTRRTGTETLASAHESAIDVRASALAALDGLASGDEQLELAMTVALGTSTTEEELAQSLDRLAALATTWAADPALAEAAKAMQVDASLADELATAAARLRAAATEETRRMTTLVSQGDLDHQDGVVLEILRHLMKVYDAANRRDRRVRRLIPQATNRIFRRSGGASDDEVEVLQVLDDGELPPEP